MLVAAATPAPGLGTTAHTHETSTDSGADGNGQWQGTGADGNGQRQACGKQRHDGTPATQVARTLHRQAARASSTPCVDRVAAVCTTRPGLFQNIGFVFFEFYSPTTRQVWRCQYDTDTYAKNRCGRA
jgi:hypothetical protein